jgi:MIP family channel proteins
VRVWLAELLGTFALVFAGVSAVAAGWDAVGVALAFGLAVGVMVAAVGPISGAHFNPAVTVAFLTLGRISLREVPRYWSAQLSGSVLAMLLLQGTWGEALAAAGYGVTRLAPQLAWWTGGLVEVVLTFFLMLVIASVVIRNHAMDGLYIGLTVGLGALAGGALTGASMNPARSFGPALVSGEWTLHGLYWLAPMAGAVLAARCAAYLWRVEASAGNGA